MKKFDDSRKAALQCLAALPRYAPALNNLALLQVTLGQLTDADGNLRASIDADQALACAQSNAASLQVLFQNISYCVVCPVFRFFGGGLCFFRLALSHFHVFRMFILPLQKLRQRELLRIQSLGGEVNFSS